MNMIIEHKLVKEFSYYPENAKELTNKCIQVEEPLIPKLLFRFTLCEDGYLKMDTYAAFENSTIEKKVLTTRYHNRNGFFDDKMKLMQKVNILINAELEKHVDWEELFLREEFKIDNWLSPKFQDKHNNFTMELVKEFLRRNEEDYYD